VKSKCATTDGQKKSGVNMMELKTNPANATARMSLERSWSQRTMNILLH
jgi:hypothetical protein